MKKITAMALASLLVVGAAIAAEPSEADQKWLKAVEKMVVDGQTRVSTPSETRVNLLKEWAGKNGYTAQVSKTDVGYKIELSKELAKK